MAYLSRPQDPSSEKSLRSLQLVILEHWQENDPPMMQKEPDWNPREQALERARQTVAMYQQLQTLGPDQAWSEAMREVALKVSK